MDNLPDLSEPNGMRLHQAAMKPSLVRGLVTLALAAPLPLRLATSVSTPGGEIPITPHGALCCESRDLLPTMKLLTGRTDQ